MRVVIVGQQAFGKAVLDAFAGRGDQVVAVFSPPEQPGSKVDPLKAAALEHQIPVFHFQNYGTSESLETLRDLKADIGLLAFVTHILPQAFVRLPKHGMLLFHPSLLPLHRGPSAINWAVINGEKRTGLTILRPSDGLDEGAIILQREVEIGPDDTVGTLYFDKIFHMGVAAMIETAQAVVAGRAKEHPQNESLATYQGWVREREAHIDWASSVDRIYDLIRGCDPAPGAWTTYRGQKLQLFDARKRAAATFGAVRGLKAGQVVAVTLEGFSVYAQGGFIEVKRCRLGEGKKIAAGEAGLEAGALLGE
jgi:methionyl-tRNA formyltransferase